MFVNDSSNSNIDVYSFDIVIHIPLLVALLNWDLISGPSLLPFGQYYYFFDWFRYCHHPHKHHIPLFYWMVWHIFSMEHICMVVLVTSRQKIIFA